LFLVVFLFGLHKRHHSPYMKFYIRHYYLIEELIGIFMNPDFLELCNLILCFLSIMDEASSEIFLNFFIVCAIIFINKRIFRCGIFFC